MTLQDDVSQIALPFEIAIIVLAIISSFISLLVPALYYLHNKCTQHPTPLIAIISLLQALSNYNVILISLNIYQVERFVHIKYVFDVMTFHKPAQPSQAQFCEINFIVYIILELLSIAYNICFSVDLLLTLQLPFFAGKKRMKFYHMFTILFTAIALPFSVMDAQEICENEFHSQSIYKIPKSFLISLLVFQAFSLLIMLLSFKKRQEAPIRTRYIKHHRVILFTLALVWLFPIVTNVFLLYEIDKSSTLFNVFNIMSFFSLVCSGGIVNVVRFINDRYLWKQIRKMFQRRKKRRGNRVPQASEVDDDVWNVCLANAVSMFQNQQVINNIIQIVLETCTENEPELEDIEGMKQKQSLIDSLQSRLDNPNYIFKSTMSIGSLKSILNNGSIQDLKRIVRINKELKMVIENEAMGNGNQKSVLSIVPNNPKNKKDKVLKQITISVKSYADPIFLSLRLKDGLDENRLKKILDLSLNSQNIRQSRQSLGASGSFFFFSFDNRIVIKTIPPSEVEVLLKLLPYYYKHIAENPKSLLSRFYGLFSVEIAGISKIDFLMMENTFQIFQDNEIEFRKYDLKGSTISREVKGGKTVLGKDVNYLHSNDAFLFMSRERKEELFNQVKADITLLSNHNIMDYSLLLGVGKSKRGRQVQGEQNWRYFSDGSEVSGKVYSISLIDYLQEFNMNKYMERMLKKVFKGGGDISSIDAQAYCRRFLNLIRRIIVVYNN